MDKNSDKINIGEEDVLVDELDDVRQNEFKYNCISELIGMCLFVTIVGTSIGINLFFGLYLAQIMFVPLCGAHYNPNVTLGQYLALNPKPGENLNGYREAKLKYYIISQLIGTAIAEIICMIINSQKIIAPVIPVASNPIQAFLGEVLFGGLLIFVNLWVACPTTSPTSEATINVLLFTSALYAFIYGTIQNSGGSLNPAIGLVGNLFGIIFHRSNGKKYFTSLVINTIGPIFGAIIFSILFKNFFEPAYSKLMKLSLIRAEIAEIKQNE